MASGSNWRKRLIWPAANNDKALLKFKREHTIALTVLGGIALLAFGVNYLKGLDLLQRRNIYYAVYSSVQGITEASPLQLNGFKVGQVVGARLMPDGSGRIVLAFQVSEQDLTIPKGSRIEIGGDFFNTWAELVRGTSTELAHRGDTLVGNVKPSLTESVGSQIDPLKRKAEGMIANIDSVLSALQAILNKNTIGDIDTSFASVRSTMETFNATARRLDALVAAQSLTIGTTMDNLQRVSANLAAQNDEIARIFTNLDTVSAALASGRLEKVLNDLSASSGELKAVMETINRGEGTLGSLAKDDSLYDNLNAASHELDLLLEDMRVNPNRYFSVFGKKDKLPRLSDSDVERIKQAMTSGR